MNDFQPGEVVETTRAYQYTTDRSAPRHFAGGRFVVDAANRITGTLYVHAEGRPAKRWNEYLIDATDARRPGPGELAEEYGDDQADGLGYEASWYANPWSECPACGHGPQWHNDPSGCTRMNPTWCSCTRYYGAAATGPDDFEETSDGQ